MNRLMLIIGCLMIAAGCGEVGENDTPMPLDQVPPSIMKVARDKFPEVKFDSAYKETKDGKEVFEVRGKSKDGKIREVEVTADGKILEVD